MRKSELEKRNPIVSAAQYGLMAAAKGGRQLYGKPISQAVAEEMMRKTPKKKRSKFARELAAKRNPTQHLVIEGYLNDVEKARKDLASKGYKVTNISSKLKGNKRVYTISYKEQKYGDFYTGNPGGDFELQDARSLSHEWHGRPSEQVIDVDVVERYDSTVVDLGELEEFGVVEDDYDTCYEVYFKSNRPTLAGNLDRNNLEIVGGDQSLNVDTRGKREIALGHVYNIVYETDKHHLEDSDGNFASYVHYFGEEYYRKRGYNMDDFDNDEDFYDVALEDGIVEDAIREGYLPTVIYDTVNRSLKLVGGKYKITAEGIRN